MSGRANLRAAHVNWPDNPKKNVYSWASVVFCFEQFVYLFLHYLNYTGYCEIPLLKE